MADPAPAPAPEAAPAPAPAPTPAVTPAPASEAAPDWRAGLPEELRETAKNFKLPGDAVKSARDLRQKLSNAIIPLGDKATDEEKADYSKRVRAALKVPEKADGYTIKNPENLPAFVDAERMKAAQATYVADMHAAGAPPEAVQAGIDWAWKTAIAQQTQSIEQRAAEKAKSDADLKKAWGGEFDARMALAHKAIRDYGGDSMVKTLIDTGFGNSLPLANALADLGAYRSEDGMIGGPTSLESKTLETQIADIMAKKEYWDAKSPLYKSLRDQAMNLRTRATPAGEIGPGFGTAA